MGNGELYNLSPFFLLFSVCLRRRFFHVLDFFFVSPPSSSVPAARAGAGAPAVAVPGAGAVAGPETKKWDN